MLKNAFGQTMNEYKLTLYDQRTEARDALVANCAYWVRDYPHLRGQVTYVSGAQPESGIDTTVPSGPAVYITCTERGLSDLWLLGRAAIRSVTPVPLASAEHAAALKQPRAQFVKAAYNDPVPAVVMSVIPAHVARIPAPAARVPAPAPRLSPDQTVGDVMNRHGIDGAHNGVEVVRRLLEQRAISPEQAGSIRTVSDLYKLRLGRPGRYRL